MLSDTAFDAISMLTREITSNIAEFHPDEIAELEKILTPLHNLRIQRDSGCEIEFDTTNTEGPLLKYYS
jgi:hypothetical protein